MPIALPNSTLTFLSDTRRKSRALALSRRGQADCASRFSGAKAAISRALRLLGGISLKSRRYLRHPVVDVIQYDRTCTARFGLDRAHRASSVCRTWFRSRRHQRIVRAWASSFHAPNQLESGGDFPH